MRLALALSIAALLAVFLLYTSIAGGGTPSLRPSQLLANDRSGNRVTLSGKVVGAREQERGEAGCTSACATSKERPPSRSSTAGASPDLFRTGRDISVDGRLRKRRLRRREGHARDEVPVQVLAEKVLTAHG